MKKLLVVLIALSMIGVFSSPSWAQPEEEEPEPVQPGNPEVERVQDFQKQDIQKIEGRYDQVEKVQELQKIEGEYNQVQEVQELQKIEGEQNQAATIDTAVVQKDGWKVQSIKIEANDKLSVESGYYVSGVQASRKVLLDKGSDGVLDSLDEGSGAVAYSAIEKVKRDDADVQYDFAMQRFGKTLQAVAVALDAKSFGQKEKCNQFVTEDGAKYEIFGIAGKSDKGQPIILGYKVKQTVDGETVMIDVGTDSTYKGAFKGILSLINQGDCPLSEWIIIPEQFRTKAN